MQNRNDTPKLFGRMSYGAGIWRLHTTADGVSIGPAPAPYAAALYCIFLGLAMSVGIWWFNERYFSHNPEAILAKIAAVFAPCVMSAFAIAMLVIWAKDREKPDRFSFSITDRIVRLPRAGKAWPVEAIDHWEIVSGAWTKGDDAGPIHWPDVICELHLVLKHPQDGQLAFPVVGGQGRHGLDKIGKALSDKTGIRLVEVNEPTPFFHPPRSINVGTEPVT